ncbi:MAG: DIP1984 family protein [Bacillota bacterium]
MKLAEALLERKRIKEEINALRIRLVTDARVQEGDEPAEYPEALMEKVLRLVTSLEQLTIAINRTNAKTMMPNRHMSLMEAIAFRDGLKLRYELAHALADAAAGGRDYRTTRSEIKFVPTVDVAYWRQAADEYAKRYRELDAEIQAANWSVDLDST